jgi:hypothetical protein
VKRYVKIEKILVSLRWRKKRSSKYLWLSHKASKNVDVVLNFLYRFQQMVIAGDATDEMNLEEIS